MCLAYDDIEYACMERATDTPVRYVRIAKLAQQLHVAAKKNTCEIMLPRHAHAVTLKEVRTEPGARAT